MPEGIELGERHKPDLAAIYPHLVDRGSQSSPPNGLGEPFLAADVVENGKPLQHPVTATLLRRRPDKVSQKCYLPFNSTPSINSPKVFQRSETML